MLAVLADTAKLQVVVDHVGKATAQAVGPADKETRPVEVPDGMEMLRAAGVLPEEGAPPAVARRPNCPNPTNHLLPQQNQGLGLMFHSP